MTEAVKAFRTADAGTTIGLTLGGARFRACGTTRQGKAGRVDRPIGGVRIDEFDGVLLPSGAMNTNTMRESPEVLAFLKSIQDAEQTHRDNLPRAVEVDLSGSGTRAYADPRYSTRP